MIEDYDQYGNGEPERTEIVHVTVWKLGEEGADAVIDMNCRVFDLLRDRTVNRCKTPNCGWPISALRSKNFETPDHGQVCATCHDLYNAITMMNTRLRDTTYFRKIQAEYLKEIEEFKNKKKRWKD